MTQIAGDKIHVQWQTDLLVTFNRFVKYVTEFKASQVYITLLH